MQLFIDTGNVKEIEALVPLGIIDGITTNPSLLAKEPGDPRAILKRICEIVGGPVSAEVVATDVDGMLREGRELAAIDEHIVVKVPFGKAGVTACRTLSPRRHPRQRDAHLLRRRRRCSPRRSVRPTSARSSDGWTTLPPSGMDLIEQIVDIFDNYEFGTEVLVASVRHPIHVVQAARMGADICTCPAPGHRVPVQPSADRHRSRALPEGLGEGSSRAGGITECPRGCPERTVPRKRVAIVDKRQTPASSNAAPSSAAAKSACAASTKRASSQRASASSCCSIRAPSRSSTRWSCIAASTSGWPIR